MMNCPGKQSIGLLPCIALLFSCMLLNMSQVLGQTGQVSGIVVNAETREALSGVNLTLIQHNEVVAGAVSSEDGRYVIGSVLYGSYQLSARFVGYQKWALDINVDRSVLEQDIELRPGVLDLDEVEVTARRDQPVSDTRVSLMQVEAQSVREMAGGGEDLMRVLQTLPGVLSISDYSNQLIIRGGTPDQNLILLDGIEVFSPYQLHGMGSVINPGLIRAVDLQIGGFPVQYGDRLTSVLAVHTRDGISDEWVQGRVGVNMTSIHGVLEGRLGFWGGSWMFGARRTYFDSFANSFAHRTGIFNDIAFPEFADIQAKTTFRPSRGHLVRLTGLYSRDVLDWEVHQDTFGELEAEDPLFESGSRSRNMAIGLNWIYTPSDRTQLQIWANGYRNRGRNGLTGGLVPLDDKPTTKGFTTPPPVFGGQTDPARFDYRQTYRLQKGTLATHVVMDRGRHRMEMGGWYRSLEQYPGSGPGSGCNRSACFRSTTEWRSTGKCSGR